MFIDVMIENESKEYLEKYLADYPHAQYITTPSCAEMCSQCQLESSLARLYCVLAQAYDRSSYILQNIDYSARPNITINYLSGLLYLIYDNPELIDQAVTQVEGVVAPDVLAVMINTVADRITLVATHLFPWLEVVECSSWVQLQNVLGGITVVRAVRLDAACGEI